MKKGELAWRAEAESLGADLAQARKSADALGALAAAWAELALARGDFIDAVGDDDLDVASERERRAIVSLVDLGVSRDVFKAKKG